MKLLEAIPEKLRRTAYVAGEEGAWSRADAIDVISHLASAGAVVCRIEVWLPTQPGPTIPTPFIYQWESASPIQNPPDEQLVTRSGADAGDYVESFEWDEGDLEHKGLEPFFNVDAYGGPVDV